LLAQVTEAMKEGKKVNGKEQAGTLARKLLMADQIL
jgi:hypothetical protein